MYIHRKNARRFKQTAFKLKGANVKLGQLASLQVHLLPPEYIEELRDMRDQVSPTEYPMIVGTIQSEYGLSPLEIFDDFDRVPLAAASMGQVHVAKLPTGEKVAVKMLHPGLERAVDVDLWVMRRLLGFLKLVDSDAQFVGQVLTTVRPAECGSTAIRNRRHIGAGSSRRAQPLPRSFRFGWPPAARH